MTLVNWKSPLAANEIPGTRGGDVSGVEGNETVTWLMRTDSAFETMYTLFLYGVLPAYLSQHPQARYATLRKYTYRPVAATNESVGAYEVTAHYSSAPLSQEDRDKAIQDPTERPAKIEWKKLSLMVPIDQDINGKGIINVAGQPFDPLPERAERRWAATVVKNVTDIPANILEYAEAINEADFVLDGITVLKGCAKINDLSISSEFVENGVEYRTITIGMEFRAAPTGADFRDGASDELPRPEVTPEGWDLVLLNAGLQQLKFNLATASYSLIDCEVDNEPARSPQLLEETGQQLASPVKPSDVVFLVWPQYQRKDFTLLPLT